MLVSTVARDLAPLELTSVGFLTGALCPSLAITRKSLALTCAWWKLPVPPAKSRRLDGGVPTPLLSAPSRISLTERDERGGPPLFHTNSPRSAVTSRTWHWVISHIRYHGEFRWLYGTGESQAAFAWRRTGRACVEHVRSICRGRQADSSAWRQGFCHLSRAGSCLGIVHGGEVEFIVARMPRTDMLCLTLNITGCHRCHHNNPASDRVVPCLR